MRRNMRFKACGNGKLVPQETGEGVQENRTSFYARKKELERRKIA